MDSKEVWGCFLMSGVRMLPFLKDWWKFTQIHQYYTMALLKAQEEMAIWRNKAFPRDSGLPLCDLHRML